MRLLSVVLCLHLFAVVCAVKHELFKQCSQAGFCARNRHYAHLVAATGLHQYFVHPEDIHVSESGVWGTVIKALSDGRSVPFQFHLLLLEGDSVRFTVTETRKKGSGMLNTRRFDGTAAAAFGTDPASKTARFPRLVTRTSHSLAFLYGPHDAYVAELSFEPLRLTVAKNGLPVVVVNERQFLNIEHFRTSEDEAINRNVQLESDFELFSDSFADSRADTLPMGPEAVAVDVSLPGCHTAYGIPEHADALSLRDTTDSQAPYRLFNVDVFEYETNSQMAMYGAIPLLLGVAPNASAGIFWVNAADTFVDIDKKHAVRTHWMSENGVLDVVLIVGDTPASVTQRYGVLTGNTQLPPKFALGYHQCRWNYMSEKDLLDVHSQMDQHQVPYDTIWLDVEYTDKKKYFTWDAEQFPHPEAMISRLDETGRNLVVIVDPHLKTGYDVSEYVVRHGLAMRACTGEPYKGHCWPGESVWIDSLNPRSQEYWDHMFRNASDSFIGTHENVHIWNDMNEPSVFSGPETTAPRDNLHYGGYEHRSVHNIVGKSFHELTYRALVQRQAQSTRQRPFVLTRSFFAGSQRTAAMWTGDNMARWEYLKISIPMVLTMNVVNMPFAGADVGGFFGDPSDELLTRWYQTGIWYPFFRAHAHIDSKRREVYLAGEPHLSAMRDAIRLRYALLPTLYTLFFESSVSGAPVCSPMAFNCPQDVQGYNIDDQFFWGASGLLVKPITDEGASSVGVYIPADNEIYYDYTNGRFGSTQNAYSAGVVTKNVGLGDIPIFLKGGSVITRQDRYRRSSKLMARDPYTLVVSLSKAGTARGSLYLDDGESFAYENGEYSVVNFEWESVTLTCTSTRAFAQGAEGLEVERILVVGVRDEVQSVSIHQNGHGWDGAFGQTDLLVEIKNPRLRLSSNWTVELIPKVQHDEL